MQRLLQRSANIGKAALVIISLALVCVCMAGCSSPATNTGEIKTDPKFSSGIHHARVTVEGYGAFTIELDANQAPATVQNFCDLAKSGFYDGLTFHRVVGNFCLQGGDPDGNGAGHTDNPIKGEFSSNGVANSLADNFVKGTVAMARTADPNSATCQFFVTLSDAASASLNGQYAAFGTVDAEGMKVVSSVVAASVSKASGTNGVIGNKADQPVIKKIEITD